MDDIVERLRQYTPLTCSACDNWAKCGYGEPCDCACHTHPCREAADEIERLQNILNSQLDVARHLMEQETCSD